MIDVNASFARLWADGYELHSSGQKHRVVVYPLRLRGELDMIRRLRDEEIGLLEQEGKRYLVHRVGDEVTYYAAEKVELIPPF